MFGKQQTVGEVIERLIFIKDNYGIENLECLDAINNACNILDHKFDRLTTVDKLLSEEEECAMQAIAISNGYTTGKVYVIWEIPHDNITGYEVWRNGVVIASSLIIDGDEFVSPTMFDHDHNTNLFKKDSTSKLMYIDENVQKYQNYEYQIIALRLNDGVIVEDIESNIITIQAQ